MDGAPTAATWARSGSRDFPSSGVLPPDARSCRGSSLSRVCPERSGGTRRPQAVVPLTGSFRGDRIARRGRTARPLWQARSRGCVTAGGRAGGGCGETARRQSPAPCVPNAEAAGQAAAPQRRDSPSPRPSYGAALPDRPAHPLVPRAHCTSRARGPTARRAEGVPLMLVKKLLTHAARGGGGAEARRWSEWRAPRAVPLMLGAHSRPRFGLRQEWNHNAGTPP